MSYIGPIWAPREVRYRQPSSNQILHMDLVQCYHKGKANIQMTNKNANVTHWGYSCIRPGTESRNGVTHSCAASGETLKSTSSTTKIHGRANGKGGNTFCLYSGENSSLTQNKTDFSLAIANILPCGNEQLLYPELVLGSLSHSVWLRRAA